jgi:hypothetical protein
LDGCVAASPAGPECSQGSSTDNLPTDGFQVNFELVFPAFGFRDALKHGVSAVANEPGKVGSGAASQDCRKTSLIGGP